MNALPEETRALTDADVERLVASVESATLPRADWTHAAHIAYATAIVRRDGDRALDTFHAAIQRLNTSHGVLTTPSSGYHETISRFYIWAVGRHLRSLPPGTELGALATNAVEALLDRSIPLRYYSKARLMSSDARFGWVEPDLMPMDGARRYGLPSSRS